MSQFLHVTRVLAISGLADYSFMDEDALWRGSEVHRMVDLANRGTLDRKRVPKKYRGFLAARDKFVKETGFEPTATEHEVKNAELGIVGRLDAAGCMKKERIVVDFKTGTIRPAVALQMVLYGHMHWNDGKWGQRWAVQLHEDGEYSMRCWDVASWHVDLSTAKSAVRIARWKISQGLE